ncbi:transcription antitermination factor NusB [Enterococcus thailandicus]|uniref:Transcription antitermination protein NusB n=1 Tax=Enterococcus thailandicus TaxID=417368 RepID=A0A249SKE4_ENTTH|nr:transcription antitermination factor NusB [Enterococcus thailandicus]ASZ08001.1 transcription antitermination factor NusB [Enterococcus thailandicus]MDA3973419.1 transcription antitermination factor NusB [Enterococcus thailandicus]MDA3975996.1 transcription antitermination factor NusB [Enterococcus thailandicus]MDA3980878.1 transcription antitermination factor NusB [Enterococcus thailandicus]MDT2752368.1 transcription antitermination factor NusB [Enterococcus thailandicus]
MNKEISRHKIREMALQALFPLDFNADLTKEDAIMHAIELDQRELINEEESEFVPVYLDTLVGGVCAKKDELDQMIEKHLKNNWRINRISKMDLVILRIAIFEMKYVTDVPAPVALNEAIELTKTFSDDRSRKFVNGVLSNILNEMEAGA